MSDKSPAPLSGPTERVREALVRFRKRAAVYESSSTLTSESVGVREADVVLWEDIDDVLDALNIQQQAERETLLAALRTYGEHQRHCWQRQEVGDCSCTCGFEAALASGRRGDVDG